MDALLRRFRNFILLLKCGEDRVCTCTCGRDQVYHVIPYNAAESMEVSRENFMMSHQQMNVLAGLVSGLCISWFLLRLDRVWFLGLKHWWASRMNNVGFCPQFPRFSISNMRDFFRRLHTGDSRENMGHTKQEVDHTVNDNI